MMPIAQQEVVAQAVRGIILLTVMMTTNMRRLHHRHIMPHVHTVMAVVLFMPLICMETSWLIIMAIHKPQRVEIAEVVDR